jgi:hypothetical protein
VYSYNDTIPFSVSVSDDEEVSSVSVYLADENLSPVTAPKNISVNQKSATVHDEYSFAGRYLDGYNYYLVFAVNDKSQFTKAIVQVRITPLQKVLTDIFVIQKIGNTYNLGRMSDSLGTPSQLVPLTDEPLDMICNGYCQQVSVLFSNGKLTTYNYPGMDEAWSISQLNNPILPYYSHLDVIENNTVCATAYGKIYYFDQNGNIRKTISTGTGHQQTQRFFYTDNHIVSLNTGYSGSLSSITVSSQQGTGIVNEYMAAQNQWFISEYSSTEVLIWSNDKVYTFNFQNPYLYFKKDIPTIDTITGIFTLDESNQLIFFKSSTYFYNPLFNAFTYINDKGARDVFYDPQSDRFYGVKNNAVYIFSGSTVLSEYVTPNELIVISGLYNK